MSNHLANFGIRLGKRLTWWFTVAWNISFALWIIGGGLTVEGVYLVADAQAATLPIIAGWAIGNGVVLTGWYVLSNRQAVAQ